MLKEITTKTVIQAKKSGKYLITSCNTTLDNIRDLFFDLKKLKKRNEELTIQQFFPPNYNSLVWGDFCSGVKYVDESKELNYMLFSANTFRAWPQQIAVGKPKDGKVYLVKEHFPNDAGFLSTIIVREEYFEDKVIGFVPRRYERQFFMPSQELNITNNDIMCIKIAYEAIKAFNNLFRENM